MLEKDPKKRITIEELKSHKWVNKLRETRLTDTSPEIITLTEEDLKNNLDFFQKFTMAVYITY
jgi:hypothetical protein